MQCKNNLRQVALAFHHRHDARGAISGGVVVWTGIEIVAAAGLFEEPWLVVSHQTTLFFAGMGPFLIGLYVPLALRRPLFRP